MQLFAHFNRYERFILLPFLLFNACFLFTNWCVLAQNPGDVLINEVVTDPQRDWSSGGFDGTTPGTTVSDIDTWVELYIAQSGIDLTGWTISVEDGTPFSGDLTSSGAFQSAIYFGAGSFENTASGDYLILGNPQSDQEISNTVTITLRNAASGLIDQVEISSSSGTGFNGDANNDIDFESVSRVPSGVDTDVDADDFVKTIATLGASNSPTGIVLINEVVSDPVQNWSDDGFTVRNPGGVAGANDEWIELLIQTSGLNLTRWEIQLEDGTPLSGDLTDTGAFQSSVYLGAGAFNHTQAGDFLILGNPVGGAEAINNEIYIILTDSYGNVVDDVELGDAGIAGDGAPDGSSAGIGTESVFRIPAAPDTDNDAVDFQKGPPSLATSNGVIYADASALDDTGTGSISDPKQLLQSAVDLVAQDGIVVIAGGSYDESVVITENVSFIPEVGAAVSSLELNGGNLQLLENSITVSNTLIMTQGILDIDLDDGDKADDPVFVLPPVVSGADFGSETHFEGKLEHEVAGAVSYTFEVGDEGSYRPATILPTNTTTFEVSHVQESLPADIQADFIGSESAELGELITSALNGRYWQVDVIFGVPGSTEISLLLEIEDGISNPASLGMTRFDGANWIEMSRIAGAGSGPFTLSAATSSFSPITVYSTSEIDNPLPVELIHFSGRRLDDHVMLNWSTATEVNSEYFQVEHSADGSSFLSIGSIPSHGHSSIRKDYAFIHESIEDRPHYYRLKMVDFDATYEYSPTIRISPDLSEYPIEIYPNPTTGFVHIEGVNPAYIDAVRILNLNGVVEKAILTINEPWVPITELPNGYFLFEVLLSDGSLSRTKLLKR